MIGRNLWHPTAGSKPEEATARRGGKAIHGHDLAGETGKMDRRPLRWKYNQMTTPLTIEYVDSAHEARRWRDQGYCPIECAFGEESVVDALQMDHHGTMGDLEGVAVRACRDHYGSRKADPRFVVAGAADADAHLTRKVNAFAGVCISVYLHCNSRNCSQPAKKFRGFPFFQLPISINSDLFRISGFGFPAPLACGHHVSAAHLRQPLGAEPGLTEVALDSCVWACQRRRSALALG